MASGEAVDLVDPCDSTKGDDEVDQPGDERSEAGVVGAQVQLAEAVLPVERRP